MLRYIIALVVLLAGMAHAEAPLRVVLVSGSWEYDSERSLTHFADWLEAHYHAETTLVQATHRTRIPGIEALDEADVALFYTRRLLLTPEPLGHIKRYIESGRPFVAVRTASHGFQNWLEFDAKVLGGNYQGHQGEGPAQDVRVMLGGRDHPIFDGVGKIRSQGSLYNTGPVASDCDVLMTSRTIVSDGSQPAAWTRTYRGGRLFYTSLGTVSDFEGGSFKRMLAQALYWTTERETAPRPLPPLPEREEATGTLRLAARVQVPGSDPAQNQPAPHAIEMPLANTALLLCDMWDRHWCDYATARVDALAHRMAPLVAQAREAGMQIVHAPSDTLGFYTDTPARRRAQQAPPAAPITRDTFPGPPEEEPPLPIDDSDGGCPDEQTEYTAWTRQHPAIGIDPLDALSDNGDEVYNVLRQHGIDRLIVMGVHTNMCVLGRSFAIRAMTQRGIQCVLVRDLTDTMYNPAMPPHVPHDEGTARVVRHIEQFWAPAVTEAELRAALSAATNEAR